MTTKIKTIRQKRLKQLLDERFEGTQSKLAEHVGVAANLISRYLSGKGIGEDMKKKIQDACGLNKDWLDGVDEPGLSDIDGTKLTVKQMQMMHKIANMSDEQLEKADHAFKTNGTEDESAKESGNGKR